MTTTSSTTSKKKKEQEKNERVDMCTLIDCLFSALTECHFKVHRYNQPETSNTHKTNNNHTQLPRKIDKFS